MAAPLQSVTTVKYYDASGVLQTLASTVYQVDTVSQPGRIVLAPTQIWPTVQANAPGRWRSPTSWDGSSGRFLGHPRCDVPAARGTRAVSIRHGDGLRDDRDCAAPRRGCALGESPGPRTTAGGVLVSAPGRKGPLTASDLKHRATLQDGSISHGLDGRTDGSLERLRDEGGGISRPAALHRERERSLGSVSRADSVSEDVMLDGGNGACCICKGTARTRSR
jgi:hypothetical protein